MDDSDRITFLQNRVNSLENELQNTQEKLETTCTHLKKYTAPNARRVYYERHKEVERQRSKEYKERTGYQYKPTKEQTKMYNKTARDKMKEKKELEKVKNLEENN